MKIGFFAAILGLAINESTAINIRNANHEILDYNSLSPLQISQLMSGDWTATLPSQIRDFASKLLGQENTNTLLNGLQPSASGLTTGSGPLLDSQTLNAPSFGSTPNGFFHKKETTD